MDCGIQVIYQDLSLFPDLTVAENISFNNMIESTDFFVSAKKNIHQAAQELTKLNHHIDLKEYVRNLSIADKQIVAIARAMSLDAKLIIMDEPTTALTKNEVEVLLKTVLDLKNKGVAIIFVSHKLDEVFKISDNITVLRDGYKVGDFDAQDIDEKSLTYHMTGREISYEKYTFNKTNDESIIKIDGLNKENCYENISLELFPGEIVGITGLLGAGRTELALSLFGLNKPDSGDIFIENKKVNIQSPIDAVHHGIGLLPEDRHLQGLFMENSIKENIISPILNRLVNKLSFLNNEKRNEVSRNWYDNLRIKASSIDAPPRSLSGGNQQRVVLAKWLSTNPKLFILDSPTVGIDVGSKSEIHALIKTLAEKGMGIIIISDEISEIYHNCSRVIVMKNGKFIFDKATSQTSEEELREITNRGDE